MTRNAKTYDPRCYDLAALFLSDETEKNTEANRDKLAALIQQTIEDEIQYGMTPAVVLQDGGGAA